MHCEPNQTELTAINRVVSTFFKDNDGNAVTLTPSQLKLFALATNPYINRLHVMTTTQFGKSYTLALVAIWLAKVCKEDVLIVAPTEEQSKIIMNYVVSHIFDHPVFTVGLTNVAGIEKMKTERTKESIVYQDGGSIKSITVGAMTGTGIEGRAVMGLHATVILSDECGLIPNGHWSKILRIAGGHVKKAKIIKIGNPFSKWDKEKPHHFYRSSQDDRYVHFVVDYKQAIVEGRLTETFIEEARSEMSDNDFKVLYEVQFPDNNGEQMVFDEAQIDNMLTAQFDSTNGVVVAGLDVSGAGKDKTVLTIALIGDGIELVEQIEIAGTSITEKSDVVHNLCKQKRVEIIAIDVVGVGKGLSDNLVAKQDRLYSVKEYIAGASPSENLYANLKSEVVYYFQKLLRDKMIRVRDDFPIDTLRKEMLQLRERVLADRRKKTDDPVQSPDHLDSVLACLYASINAKPYKLEFY